MKKNFSEGFVPEGERIQSMISEFSGRTGTNMESSKKRFKKFYKQALAKQAMDDMGMAGQPRLKPKPPAPNVGDQLSQAPRVKGVRAPKVPVATPTGLAKQAYAAALQLVELLNVSR